MCLIGNKHRSRIIMPHCQSYTSASAKIDPQCICPHFTSSGKKSPVSMNRSIHFHYIQLCKEWCCFQLEREKKKSRGRKVPNLGCVTHKSLPVQCKILQEGTEEEKIPKPKTNAQQSRCFYFCKKKEFAIRTTTCCVLFSVESLNTDVSSRKRYLPENMFTFKGKLNIDRKRHAVKYLGNFIRKG